MILKELLEQAKRKRKEICDLYEFCALLNIEYYSLEHFTEECYKRITFVWVDV